MNDLHPLISVDLLRRIDATCDRFEESWIRGSKPQIEDYLKLFRADEWSPLMDALQSLQQELILRQRSEADRVPKTIAMKAIKSATDVSTPDAIDRKSPPPGRSNNDPGVAQVTFSVVEGPHAGLDFRFEDHSTLFAGRSTNAQLRLEKDRHFSRHHFRLEINPPTCFLMDLNSRNGTFVNDEKVTDRFLCNGDVVSGGNTKMVVSIFDPQAERIERADETLIKEAPSNRDPEPPRISPKSTPEPQPATTDAGQSPLSIPGYNIHEQIGAGDLGVVYRAHKISTNEECALKILTPAAHTDEKSISAFLREASVLNQLQHPHIIRLIEMGSAGPNVFLATEYASSISWLRLVSRFTAEKRIRVACQLMNQILGALEYAHTRSMVHRDVKPGNVLIVKKDDKLMAKLSDFGLAKQYTTAGMSQVTRDGDVLGSLPFMSPDQFLNSREARPTCDLYSAGATLYWMLTGQEPIVLEGHPCKFLAILESEPTPIRQHNPDIPEPLAQIVHRALEKTPEKRFITAAEMRQQLRIFLN